MAILSAKATGLKLGFDYWSGPRVQFKWSEQDYMPYYMKKVPIGEVRKEYSRLRDVAQKRIKRIGEKYPESDVYRLNKDKYKKLSEMKSESEIRGALAELKRFLSAERGSVTGIRRAKEKAIETMKRHGYGDMIKDEADWDSFGKFWEYLHATGIARLYGSEELVDFYYDGRSVKDMPADEFKVAFDDWRAKKEAGSKRAGARMGKKMADKDRKAFEEMKGEFGDDDLPF